MRFAKSCLVACLPFAVACATRDAVSKSLPDYGRYERDVLAETADAQAWFDHGLTLVYGFNHEQGIAAFQHATELDPGCAMAWWGIAYGNGVDLNNMEVSEDEARLGAEAAQRALELTAGSAGVERMLIEAAAARAVFPLPADRAELDQAYAARMEDAWRAYPDDPDVGALYAESLMNLQPWDYWTAEGAPLQRAEEIVAVLERALLLDPEHPGANHFYIHAVEASGDVERALPSAHRLRTRVPGSGHLVHMPSHIYINTGDYDLAVQSNLDAIAADEAFFAKTGAPGFYSIYFLHNIHFLMFGAIMEGRSQIALDAAQRMEAEVPPGFLKEFVAYADGLLPAQLHVLVRFGRWEEILEVEPYPAFRKISVATRHYARAIALANLDRTTEARTELSLLTAAMADVPADWTVGTNEAAVVLGLARQVAEAEVLFREGRVDMALGILRAAQAKEDSLVYDEPPGWVLPVRHAHGALLLLAGRAEEAERVYREDLDEWPRNAWSLLGLQQALEAQRKHADAAALDEDVRQAWSRADVAPLASCYCGVR